MSIIVDNAEFLVEIKILMADLANFQKFVIYLNLKYFVSFG